MARTIGSKNIELVKSVTRKEVEKNDEVDPIFGNAVVSVNIEDNVITKLPEKLWDIWESADAEIRRIICDTIFEEIYK